MNNLISVIIPVYNCEQYLSEAIQSIINQSLNTEIIIVDDGSTDKSLSVAKQFNVKTFSLKHNGAEFARNFGLQKAQGDFISFLDSDDVFYRNGLDRLYTIIKNNNELMYVQGKTKNFISPSENNCFSDEPYYGLSGTLLFRRQIFAQLGNFNQSFQAGGMIDFLLRAKDSNIPSLQINTVVSNRRIHQNNMGRIRRNEEFSDYCRLLKQRLKHRLLTS